MRASPNEIFQVLHIVESPIPFEKMQRAIRKILTGKHIQRITTDHISIGEFEEILRQEDILDTLLKDPSLKRFHGYG